MAGVKRYSKHLGSLACDGCGREWSEAEDRASWRIAVRLGVLAEVLCPRCQRWAT